jgi:hypothetical protein
MTVDRLAAIRWVLDREPEHVQKNAKALMAEVAALRAALADERRDLGIAIELLAQETRDLCPDCAAVDHINHAENCGYRDLFARVRSRRKEEAR